MATSLPTRLPSKNIRETSMEMVTRVGFVNETFVGKSMLANLTYGD